MTNEEAISVIENEIQIDVRLCTDEQVDRFQTALYMAISALRAEPTGDALTLEQLREMDGEPVWVVLTNKRWSRLNGWYLVHRGSAYLARIDDWELDAEEYGVEWLAYRRPPERGVHTKGCKNCPAYAKCTVTYRWSACAALRSTYGIGTDPEIITNADRIRAMSDEELAEWMCSLITASRGGLTMKKRKYFRKCGICGERFEQSEMVRDEGSPTGWLCVDCHMAQHLDYDEED